LHLFLFLKSALIGFIITEKLWKDKYVQPNWERTAFISTMWDKKKEKHRRRRKFNELLACTNALVQLLPERDYAEKFAKCIIVIFDPIVTWMSPKYHVLNSSKINLALKRYQFASIHKNYLTRNREYVAD